MKKKKQKKKQKKKEKPFGFSVIAATKCNDVKFVDWYTTIQM